MTFSVYLTWLFMAVLNPNLLMGMAPDESPSFVYSEHLLIVYAFLIASSIVLLLVGLLDSKIPRPGKPSMWAIAAALFCCVGTCGAVISLFVGSFLAVLGGVVMGIGASMFVILWGATFKRFKFATVVLNSSLSFCIAYIISLILVNWVPVKLGIAITLILPFCCIAAFWELPGWAHRQHHTPPKEAPEESSPENAESLSKSSQTSTTPSAPSTAPSPGRGALSTYLGRCWASLALFGIVIGALRIICCDELLSKDVLTIELVLCGGAIVSIVVLLIALVTSRKETSWDHLFRTVMPIVIASIALIGAPIQAGYLPVFFISLAFICLESLVWAFSACMAKDLDLSALRMFGIGFGLVQLGAMVGLSLFIMVVPSDTSFDMGAAMILVDAADNAQIAGIETKGIVGFKYQMALMALTLVTIAAFANAVLPRYYELKRMMARMLSSLAPALTPNAQNSSEASESLAVAADTENPADSSTDATTKPQEDKGGFRRRCEEIGETYKLSGREKEVFALLAKGHNAAFIMDKLCISRSTAKTHINHIYKKMDIHTQQELLNMVEERDRGPRLRPDLEGEQPQQPPRRMYSGF